MLRSWPTAAAVSFTVMSCPSSDSVTPGEIVVTRICVISWRSPSMMARTAYLLASGDATWTRGDASRGLFVGELDLPTQDAVLRLARLLDTPRYIPVLAPLALRELHYRLLSGPYSATIAQMAIA